MSGDPICLYCGEPLIYAEDGPSDLYGCLGRRCGYALTAQAFQHSSSGEYREVAPSGAVRA